MGEGWVGEMGPDLKRPARQGLSGLIFDTIDHSGKAKALEEENSKIKALFSRT